MLLPALKRALAVLAVGALGVAGLAEAGHATTVNEQVGARKIVLYSFAGQATDAERTVSLVAGAGADIAQVTFQYRPTGGTAWTDIATVGRSQGGAFEHDWSPGPALLDAPVDLRAVGNSSIVVQGQPSLVPSAVEPGVIVHDADPSFVEVSLDACDNRVGAFSAPYGAGRNGTYVGVTGDVVPGNPAADLNVGWVDGNGVVRGNVVEEQILANDTFRATLDIAGSYPADTTPPVEDEIVLYAEVRGPGGRFTPDARSADLYRQSITSITATPSDTTIPDSQPFQQITVHVTDQNGCPVAGAEVRSSQPNHPAQYTDATGRAVFNQNGGTTTTYWANANGSAPYEPTAGDKQTTATVAYQNDASERLVALLDDGNAFDIDEYSPGDIAVQIRRADGSVRNPAPGQRVQYHWRIVPFSTGSPIIDPVPDATSAPTQGKFPVNLPTNRPAGVYELWASLTAGGIFGGDPIAEAKVVSVRTGEAAIELDGQNPLKVPAGSSADVAGTLELPDGTGLPGRTIVLRWTKGAAGAGGDPTPDAVLVDANDSGVRSTQTDANGRFTAKVTDPREAVSRAESGGRLTATGGVTPGIGSNFDATDSQDIDFVADTTVPAGSTVQVTTRELPADQTADPVLGSTPGQLQRGDLLLEGPDGLPLAGRRITLTVDHGFFVDPTLTGGNRFDPAPAPGAPYGEWRSAGSTITVTTDNFGRADLLLGIERDPGFDDDGRVTATVTATGGSTTDTTSFEWNTINETTGAGREDALRIGSVDVVRSPAAAQPGEFDPARARGGVLYDVFAFDQFGNRVSGVTATVTCASGTTGCPAVSGDRTSDFDSTGDLTVTSPSAGTWTFQASVTEPAVSWNSNATGPATSSRTVTDAFTQTWAAIEWAAASYTVNRTPAGVLEVGTVVTETLRILDKNGAPLAGVTVDASHDGSGAPVTLTTNDQGVAAYSFAGTQAGTDTVVLKVRDGSTVVRTVTDQVVFKVSPTLRISSIESLRKRDRIVVTSTDPADVADAAVTVLRRTRGGGWAPVTGPTAIGSDGQLVARPFDRNGRRQSTYMAVLAESPTSFAAESAPRQVR